MNNQVFKVINTKIDGCPAVLKFEDCTKFGKYNFYVTIDIDRKDGLKTFDSDTDDGIEHWSCYKIWDDHMFVHYHDIPELIEQRHAGHKANAEWLYNADGDWRKLTPKEWDDLVDSIVFMIEKNLKENENAVANKQVSKKKFVSEIESVSDIDALIKQLEARKKVIAEEAKRKQKQTFYKELETLEQKFGYDKGNVTVMKNRREYVESLF